MTKEISDPTILTSTAEAATGRAEVQRQEALIKTGALQDAIFNSANFSSIATDAKGVIQIFNVGAERMLGYAAADVVNKNHFVDQERAEATIKQVLSEKKVTNYELTARSRDGKETTVSYNATTFFDRDRRLQCVFAAARDITERMGHLIDNLLAFSRMGRRELVLQPLDMDAMVAGVVDDLRAAEPTRTAVSGARVNRTPAPPCTSPCLCHLSTLPCPEDRRYEFN